MNIYIPNLRLPSEYQEVEYIESSGTQKISTGYNTNSSIKIEADFMTTSSSGDQLLFGTTYGSWAWQDCLAFRSNSGFEAGAGGGNVTFYNFSIDTKHILEYTLSSATLDGTTQTYSRSSAGYELTIFYGNGKGGHTRVYSFKIYTGTTLSRDFVPCYRKSDNVIGMYDLVNNQFYTNSGTGTFTKGSDVYTNVLQNAYIGEYKGWTPGSNTKFYYPLTDDQLDKVGSTSIPITGTKENIGYTFNFTGEHATVLNNSNIGVGFISLWSKFNNYNTFYGGHYYSQGVSTNYAEIVYNYAHEGATASRTFQGRTGNTDWVLSSQQDSPTGSWFHMAYGFAGSKMYGYINGVKVREVIPGSTYTNSSISFGRLMNITYSEVIGESVVRTAEEISNYYNQTKSNYGL